MRRLMPIALLTVAAIAAAVVVRAPSAGEHTLRAAFESAVQVVPGQAVRMAGRQVGSVRKVALADGEAVLDLRIDDSAWPLHRGTVARLRYGAAAAYALRFVELAPGPKSAPTLRDGGILTSASTVTPVEFDQIYRIFGPRARRSLQGVLANGSAVLSGRSRHLARGVVEGSAGLQGTADLLGDVGRDPHALSMLVSAGHRTASALRRRDPQLRATVTNAAGTFDELARHAHAQQRALERLPAAFDSSRQSLARLDSSLGGLQALVDDLRPGAAELRRIVPAMRRTLTTLRRTAPLATQTLRSGARSAPSIGRFLGAGTPFMPQLGAAFERLAPMLACIRPYAPELAGFAGTWIGFQGNSDAVGRYARASEQKSLIPVGSSQTSKELVDTLKGRLFYAFPRPPGLNAGQPWFLPECGAGPSALDPAEDPEAGG